MHVQALILLFDGSNKLAGIFNFFNTFPSDLNNELGDGPLKANLHMENLPYIVDILRNEKPIYLGWQKDQARAFISTTQEPVGEGE